MTDELLPEDVVEGGDVVQGALAPRAHHRWGATAGSLECDVRTVLEHAAGGLGLRFQAPAPVAGKVLARRVPWAELGRDPWAALLWASGRMSLPGRADVGDDS